MRSLPFSDVVPKGPLFLRRVAEKTQYLFSKQTPSFSKYIYLYLSGLITMHKTRFIIALLLLFFIAACAEKKVVTDPPRPDLQQRAAQAWEAEDHPAAQDLYSQLLEEFELEEDHEIMAWKRLAVSAGENREYRQSMQALEKWAQMDPEAADKWKWHHYYSMALKETETEQKYVRYLQNLYRDESRPVELRLKTALTLAEHHLESQRYPEGMDVLRDIRQFAYTDEQKVWIEEAGSRLFLKMDLEELEKAAEFMDREKKLHFPDNLFWWSYFHARLQDDNDQWESLRPGMIEIARQSELVYRTPFNKVLEKWEEKLGKPTPVMALLLPLSDSYSSVGWKVMRGAGQAHWDLLSNGLDVRVKTINTNNPGWIEELKKLQNVSLAGGPLSGEAWEKIREADLHREMVFLTFLPTMEEEGSQGWRFFSSAGDQVRALLKIGTQEMDIENFAVMYPEEDFGRSYAETFWEKARDMDAQVQGIQSYPTDDHASWNRIVSSFLDITDPNDPFLDPDPGFEAVFIPDTLSRAQGLIPQFFYFNVDHLVFMGPMLWYQGYSPGTLEQQFFSLALSCGAWNSHNPSPPARQLSEGLEDSLQGEADFWVALGYDFVRFASRLGNMPSPEDNDEVNRILSGNEFDSWSMAPINWDDEGKASQDLFVFRMDRHELQPVEPEAMKWTIESRKQRRAMWLERLREQERE